MTEGQPHKPTPATAKVQLQEGDHAVFTRTADRADIHVGRARSSDKVSRVRVCADPLDRGRARGHLTAEQFEAGDKLRRTHYVAFGSGFQTVNLLGVHGVTDYSDNTRIGDRQSDAMNALSAALKGFEQKERTFLIDTCCRGENVRTAARRCNVPPNKSMDFFRGLLDRLSIWYRTGRCR